MGNFTFTFTFILCYRRKHSVDFTFSFRASDVIEVEFHRPGCAGLYPSFEILELYQVFSL